MLNSQKRTNKVAWINYPRQGAEDSTTEFTPLKVFV